MSVITATTAALRDQLLSTPSLAYCKDSGFEEYDVELLVQTNKFPFFNIICEGFSIGPTDNLHIKDFERITIDILIQYATRAIKPQIAKQGDTGHIGLYQFSEDIWNAIVSDPKLSGVVDGYFPGSSIDMTVVDVGSDNDRFFIAAAELRIIFYKDVGKK